MSFQTCLKKDSVLALTKKKSKDLGLGTNLRPFPRTDLSKFDRVKSGGNCNN